MSKGIKFFLIAFILSLPFWLGINYFQKNLESSFYAQISQPFQDMAFVKIPEKPNLDLQARAAISVKVNEAGKQKILFKKDINQPLPIASLTKQMTAVIVLENTPENDYNLSNAVTISKEAESQDDVPVFGNLKSGDKLLVKELLELMLIYSSNDAAWALSEVIETENFVKKMNQKAEILELENTHFVNPTGLDPENLHYDPAVLNYFSYSTARDLAKLTQYILKEYPLIFETSIQEPPYLIEDGIFDLFLTQQVIGGKTGYTDEAGGCILFIFNDDKGNFFINLILGTPSPSARITEMQKLIDWLML